MKCKAAALILAALLVAGCTQVQAYSATTSSSVSSGLIRPPVSPPSVRGEMAKLAPGKGNWLNLTKEQMLADADYLYQTLLDNFPYFGVIERKLGIDLKAEYETCRKEIEACKTDAQFYLALDYWIEKAGGLGHLTLFQPGMYPVYADLYKQDAANADSNDELDRQKMADVYNEPKAKASYEKMAKTIQPCFDTVNAYYAALEKKQGITPEPEQEWKNIETKILKPGEIAYIAINSLDNTTYDEDKKILFDFYAQVKDYDHVIFDFTQNGGGSMGYFNDLVAAPNTDKPLKMNVYCFLKGGKYNLSFFNTSKWKSVSTLPNLTRMNQADRKNLDLYNSTPYIVNPTGNKQLNGKLWMLVGPNVFSSSEYAAALCKSTGFMTLVGNTTGGDGIGYDPLPVVLPNSGLAVRYSAIYGTTADGASSQEWGTDPDIVSPDGESPLDTCLKAIDALSK